MGLMLVMSSIPGVAQPDDPTVFGWVASLEPRLQNVLHIPVYAVLTWLWMRYLRTTENSKRLNMILAGLICVGFAVVEESYQHLVPGRYPSLTDLAFDTLGVVLGLGVSTWTRRARENRA
jgi:VanZ family protein